MITTAPNELNIMTPKMWQAPYLNELSLIATQAGGGGPLDGPTSRTNAS